MEQNVTFYISLVIYDKIAVRHKSVAKSVFSKPYEKRLSMIIDSTCMLSKIQIDVIYVMHIGSSSRMFSFSKLIQHRNEARSVDNS